MKRNRRVMAKIWDLILIISYLIFLAIVAIIGAGLIVFLTTGALYALVVLFDFYPSREQLLHYSIPVGLLVIIGLIINKIVKERNNK
ncbi:hypothetical protein EOL99_04015 [Candidatus Falkowbacteria bacterium]|nr:hypothetical protein [Candidatus Falkowbacteria bacterium]